MKTYVGIDLGTTNSSICSYNGTDLRLWKSPEQNDVTPSVIFIDKRGKKFVGQRAYDSAPQNPGNSAMLFKREMGTITPIQFSALGITKTPEECSSEVLKTLFGYLPEELRNDPETGTVITVPAAFNLMQKEATMQAARMAGIGKVALMQEPVAAVMSVMRARNSDGIFLIYDLGGGTLDIAIAESIGGRVNLLTHGGIERCGGRDFDLMLFENVVKPWLLTNFDLPEDFLSIPKFSSLKRLAEWATEKAKIELSSQEKSTISLSESEIRIKDSKSAEIFLDIPLLRETFDKLISDRVGESIELARETISKAGFSPNDLDRIVFVGGPTNYKPLRDNVSYELGIPGSTEVNPMTAVAEGASLYAESINWESQNHSRKNTRGQISVGGAFAVSLNFIARTPDVKSKIAVLVEGKVEDGSEFQVDSIDTGWTSGRIPLKNGANVLVTLPKNGENRFKLFVFDSVGGQVGLKEDKIIITRTSATVEGIPASHSIGIAALDKLGRKPELDWLVRKGDPLPKKGKRLYKATESLKAGATGSINFLIWEGEIEEPYKDNLCVGSLKIRGSDFADGVIPAGGDLEVEYEIQDSGNINLLVSVPCIGGLFRSDKNFYSLQEGQVDFSSSSQLVVDEGKKTLKRIEEISEKVKDPKLEVARKKLETALSLDTQQTDPEKAQESMADVHGSRRILADIRKDHLKEIRQIDLDSTLNFFNKFIREHARTSEATNFDNLVKTAQRSIDRNDKDFEHQLDELRGKNSEILWRQDWFVVDRFNWLINSPHLFVDKHQFDDLSKLGTQYLGLDDIDKLRQVVGNLYKIQISSDPDDEMVDIVNIVRGS